LLVFALKELKLGEPLIHSAREFRPTSVVLMLNNWNIGIESFKIRLLALAGSDCFVEVVANLFPWTAAVSDRVPQEIGTCKTVGRRPF
jgi:hypothetical protein